MSNSSLPNRSVEAPSSDANRPVAEQFHKLKQLVFTQDTARTLGQSLHLLLVLVREALVLVWLAFCWTIVGVSWLGGKTNQTGHHLRSWWTALQASHQNQSPSQIVSETSKSVLNKGKDAVGHIVTEAKKQVGLREE